MEPDNRQSFGKALENVEFCAARKSYIMECIVASWSVQSEKLLSNSPKDVDAKTFESLLSFFTKIFDLYFVVSEKLHLFYNCIYHSKEVIIIIIYIVSINLHYSTIILVHFTVKYRVAWGFTACATRVIHSTSQFSPPLIWSL